MDGNNMYPNQNDMTGMKQNQQSAYQQNNTRYDTCRQNNAAHDTYQNQGTDPSRNMGSYQEQNGYADHTHFNNGYCHEYAGNGSQNYSNYYNYQPYQQLNPINNSELELEEPVKVGEWILTLVLMMIPCVNIILMFVFAFSKSEKKSKSNFFKAYLIFYAIALGLIILCGLAMGLIAAAM